MDVLVLTEYPDWALAKLYNCLGDIDGVSVTSLMEHIDDLPALSKRMKDADIVHFTYWNHYLTNHEVPQKSIVSVHHLVDRRWPLFVQTVRRIPPAALIVSDAARLCRFGELGCDTELVEYWIDGEAHPWRNIRMDKRFTVGILGREWDDKEYKRFGAIREATILAEVDIWDGAIGTHDEPKFKDINNFYDNIDVYVHASYIDAGPLPALEALSRGIPVISTPTGMMAKWLKDRKYGLHTTGMVDDMAAKICELRENGPRNVCVSQIDRDYLYNPTRWIEQHEAIYKRVTG